jgi:hypothetical protein
MPFVNGDVGHLALHNNSDLNAWTAYTPTLTNITLGTGSITGYYKQVGKTVHVTVAFVTGSTSSGTGIFEFGLPVTAARTTHYIGSCRVTRGATEYAYTTVMTTTTRFRPNPAVSQLSPVTWAVNDQVQLSLTYEAA